MLIAIRVHVERILTRMVRKQKLVEVKMGKLSLSSLFLIISLNGFFSPEALGADQGDNFRPPRGTDIDVGNGRFLSKEALVAITRFVEDRILRLIESPGFNISLTQMKGAFSGYVDPKYNKGNFKGEAYDFNDFSRRPGVLQEMYLSILTRLARGDGPEGTFLQINLPDNSSRLVFILKETSDEEAFQLLNAQMQLGISIEKFKEVRRKTRRDEVLGFGFRSLPTKWGGRGTDLY